MIGLCRFPSEWIPWMRWIRYLCDVRTVLMGANGCHASLIPRYRFGTRGSQVQLLSPRPTFSREFVEIFERLFASVFGGPRLMGHLWDKRRQPRDPGAQIREVDARVDIRGQPRVGVAEHALRDDERNPGAREQGRGGETLISEARFARGGRTAPASRRGRIPARRLAGPRADRVQVPLLSCAGAFR